MIRETVPVGMLQCNCTILGDETSREAMVIDPGYEIPRIMALLAKHQLTVRKIVITHAHIDHIASAFTLQQHCGAPIVYNQAELPLVAMMATQAAWFNMAVPTVKPPDHSPADDEVLAVHGIDAYVLHTPGHTPGSLCLHIPSASLLIAGDTLFAGSVGRTDLPGGNHHQLIASIQERLLPLPDATVVVAGHGAETTMGEERAHNPFLLS